MPLFKNELPWAECNLKQGQDLRGASNNGVSIVTILGENGPVWAKVVYKFSCN